MAPFLNLQNVALCSALEEKFGSVFYAKLTKAQQDKGSKRSAAFNDLGNQKTQQFIAAVVRRAVAVITSIVKENGNVGYDERFSSQGGTTDVGMHTGGRPRDTCSPLVQTVIDQNLCCGQGLFRKTMVMFKMNLLQLYVTETQDTFGREINIKDGCASVDNMFFMLQDVVQSAIELLESGYDVSSLNEKCSRLRATIEEFVNALNQQTMIRYRPPSSTVTKQLNTLECGVNVNSPKRDWECNTLENSETRHNRVLTNPERCWFLDGVTCSLETLLQWGQADATPKSYKCTLVLRTFETFMFERSLKLSGDADHILRGAALTWAGSTGVILNPFNATSISIVDSFIEQMPQSVADFQWMNAWPGQGSLRSYPKQQLRKLQCILLDDKLPWSHSCVETIVRQTLYQIGDLTEEDPKMLWKTDMLEEESGLQTFCAVLKLAANKLEQTPSCFENIPLLSELSGYLHQFTRDMQNL
ncbi:hypothetical protein L915_05629 [Phytophthora nicotianae]|uniref:Uncharacterized protein n=1 Tax=Phytophthora nicotianae TaxID=4792 RepID=W2JCA9_PHYNI|nr:hypothetical protein L915_05629 [Phytophthora nicotianae]ETL44060.1 hypothetical protein L916_05568 [Phytophthora nicotianae]